MARTITVTGIGHASVKPDQVEILFSLEAVGKNYDKVMSQTAERCSRMAAALERAGFEKNSLNTISFDVQMVWENIQKKQQNHVCALEGYRCHHALKLVFDFRPVLLSDALKAVVKSRANPEIQIQLTIKDPDAVNAQLLSDAAANAKKKAEILCHSSGAALGALLAIHDNRSMVKLESKTTYKYDKDSVSAGSISAFVGFNPEEIAVTDSATFVWEIL